MGEWPDNPPGGQPRPEFDKTIIRPASSTAFKAAESVQADPGPLDKSPAKPQQSNGKSNLWKFAGIAVIFLLLGAGGGSVALLISSGAITFSSPEDGQQSTAESVTEQAKVEDPAVSDSQSEQAMPPGQSEDAQEQVTAEVNSDELETPADPFYDMALSAVIPLAGDPVLLRSADAHQRIELSERPLGLDSGSDKFGLANAAAAYVLDSQMLDESGTLVIRAPGTEADFQFGNFGGGQDSESLDIVEEDPADAGAALPVFLKPATNTLDLYLNERPIGQGAHRIEIREAIDKAVPIETYLTTHGFDKEFAADAAGFMKSKFGRGDFVAGDKVAVRGVRLPNKIGRIGDYYRPVQMSLYAADGYLGTASLSTSRDQSGYVAGADPWFGKPFEQEDPGEDDKDGKAKSHRLIDGLYATAIRNAVPASIVGEAIAYLAPTTDLKRAVKPGERFTLLFSAQPRDEKRGGGRVLFAGVRRGDNWSVRCYVLKAPGSPRFACVNEGGKVSISGAMLVPVKGVLTSKFGMRFHPIKKTSRLHAGVDWAAPTGTPIRAAFSGKVSYRDVRGGYGNFIELRHKDGITTRYAHLHEYGEGIELESVVQAGDLIGYVGTTGLSTGPHLHFEIRQRGEPTDPLAFEMETGTDAPQTVSSPALKGYRDFVQTVLTTQ
ncbi:M23 family metallopeptidase [Labrenzia sp. PHM005]|uniref:M23 family metallopeptidase n=1 Tax=Labrenzia sp. PHM005 TaxID=2590016 RepID=UPI00114004A1|nr:M23 family metallopeptidase [Labrenzia sp. PHM005]QDG77451.1 M23 family metallopeptidase [Labrenzia sp. PHM005]